MPGGGGMGRLLPVGFLFGATDDGATQTMERIRDGTTGVAEASERAADRSSNAWERFGAAMSAFSFHRLGDIRDTLEDISRRAGAGMQATSIEQFGAQFSQTYRAATAGMGQFRGLVDEVRGQISGAAFTYQISAEGMLAATTALARSGDRLEDYGLSVRALAGAEQAGALSGENLANVLTGLADSFGLGEEGAGRLLDTVTAIGERTGAGVAATAAMPDVMAAISEQGARFPAISENVDTVVQSLMRMASAEQQALGGTFQEGVQSAIQVFNELAGQRRQLEGLITGLGTEFPELAQQIGIVSGDIDSSMSAIMQDPLRFAQSMQQLVSEGYNGSQMSMRLRAALEQMGPRFLQLVQGGDRAREAMAAASGELGNTGGAFNRMATSAAGSTRTFGESMDLLRERFQTQVNTMLRSMPGYQNFEQRVLQRQGRAFQWLGGLVRGVASDRGPFGALTRTMLGLRRGGVAGLVVAIQTELGGAFPRLTNAIMATFPALEGFGDAVWQALVTAGPFVRMLGDFGIVGGTAAASTNSLTRAVRGFGAGLWRVARVAGPIMLIATAGYLIYRYWDRLPDLIERIGETFENLATRGRDLSGTFVTWVRGIDWQEATSNLVRGFFEALAGAFTRESGGGGGGGAGGRGGRIATALGEMFYNLANGLRDMMTGIFRGLIEGVFGGMDMGRMGQALSSIYGTISRLVGKLQEMNFAGWRIFFQTLSRAIAPALRTVANYVNQVGDALSSIWIEVEPMVADFMFALDEMWGVVQTTFEEVITPILEDFVGFMSGQIVHGVFPETKEGMVDVGETMKSVWRRYIRPFLSNFLRNWVVGFGHSFRFAINIVQQFSEAGVRAFSRIRAEIEVVRETWRALSELMQAGWEGLEAIANEVWGRISGNISMIFLDIIDTWELALLRIRAQFAPIVLTVLEQLQNLIERIPASWRAMLPGFQDLEEGVRQTRDEVEAGRQQAIDDEVALRLSQSRRHDEEMARQAALTRARVAGIERVGRAWADVATAPTRTRQAVEAETERGLERVRSRWWRPASRAFLGLERMATTLAEQIESGDLRARRQLAEMQRREEAVSPLVEALGRRRGMGRQQREMLEEAIATQVRMGAEPLSEREVTALVEEFGQARGAPAYRRLAARIRGEEEAAPEPRRGRERRARTMPEAGRPADVHITGIEPGAAREIGGSVPGVEVVVTPQPAPTRPAASIPDPFAAGM